MFHCLPIFPHLQDKNHKRKQSPKKGGFTPLRKN